MRSRRRRLEWSCRIAAFALLGWLFGESAVPAPARRIDVVRGGDLAAHLSAWTRAPSSLELHAELAAAPSARIDDWLAALAHAGHSMTWSGTPSAIAMTAEAAPDPRGSVRVSVAAPAGETVTVADAAGLLDSVHITKLGGTLVTPVAAGTLVAAVRGATDSLRSDAPRPAALGSVLVIGGAGWEGKFAAAALAERGWRVITDFGVAPKIAVTGGAPPALDTARLAAVVVLDSAAATQLGKGLVRYARSGGGVVFAGDAARSRDVAAIVPGTLMPRTRPPVLPADSIGPGATGFYTVALTGDAIALERRPEGVAVAARRVGAGRAIEVGYDDSWRWRMAGGAGGASTHRAWWSQVVGSVAYVGSSGDGMATSAAPLAALVDRIGPARPAPARATRWSIDPRVLLMLILGLLLIEWASRRLRGLK